MKTDPILCPARSREVETKMCEIISRLYELQQEFDRVAPPDVTVEFDNGIVDCVTAGTSAVAEHIRSTIFGS